MAGLRDIPFRIEYRSDDSSLVDEFYIPCMSAATQYWRAVGYFTSDGLSLAAQGLATFIKAGGSMRLVASPVLSEDDLAAIEHGYAARDSLVERALLKELPLGDDQLSELVRNRLQCLAWMVAHDRLQIKLAIPKRNSNARGIYHEKQGLFFDSQGDIVAFTGSSNETVGGLVGNFESIDVFCSWSDPHGRVAQKIRNFERLWANQTNRLDVIDFPQAVRDRLVTMAPESPPEPSEGLEFPQPVQLRDYQMTAVDRWLDAGNRGILAMATGAGKTITSISALLRLYRKLGQLFVVIACPYQHLVEQWASECARFGLQPILAYQSRNTWYASLDDQILQYNVGARSLVAVIVTHTSLAGDSFAGLIGKVKPPAMIIADEVHHLGAGVWRTCLPSQFTARMGLSATPDRWMDDDGTQSIHDYFGNTVFEYSLKDAIESGRLTPYYYYPHLVELCAGEMEQYVELSAQIAKARALSQDDNRQNERYEALLRKRSTLLNHASQKLPLLESLVSQMPDLRYSLFYCAPGQKEEVVSLLGTKLGLRVHPFTAEEDSKTRQSLLESFEAGRLQGLVAMKCLDEGVDVPVTRTAFILASSSNPREFIQRRGRILRKADGKQNAVIHDLIAVPPQDWTDWEHFSTERSIVRRELMRFREFASVAVNRIEADDVVFGLAKRYHLLDQLEGGGTRD